VTTDGDFVAFDDPDGAYRVKQVLGAWRIEQLRGELAARTPARHFAALCQALDDSTRHYE